MNWKKTFIALTFIATLFTQVSHAGIINVLWLTGNDSYNDSIAQLGTGGSDDASTYDPLGDGSNSWNIDFWDTGLPDFSNYNALVIGSTCYGNATDSCSGSNGFFGLDIFADLILEYNSEIAAARGDRTFVSGQDADWHYTRQNNQGARDFLINAVNWAASGTGLGIVALADGHVTGNNSGWINADESFLKDELGGARQIQDSETVVIPTDSESFPINEGLTSARLSNWGTSSHTYFTKSELDTNEWKSINDFAVLDGDNSVTLVTASEAGGGTTGPKPIPEPSVFILLSIAMCGFARKRLNSK